MKKLILGATLLALLLVFGQSSKLSEKEAPPSTAALPLWFTVTTSSISTVNPSASTSDVNLIAATVWQVAEKIGLDPLLVLGVIHQESKFRVNAVSSQYALGLMQVMPKWHSDKLGDTPFDIRTNITAGSIVLKDCIKKHDNNLRKALACYSGYTFHTVGNYHDKVMNYRAKIIEELKNAYH